jgi:hypothetical protein
VLRYVVLATIIVLLVGVIAASLHRAAGPLRVASVASTGSPSPPRAEAESTLTPGPLTGVAPWAFVALVDCFKHERTFAGPLDAAEHRVPRGAALLERGSVIVSGPCEVDITDDGARAFRGPRTNPNVDVEVPPHLRVFASAAPSGTAGGPCALYVLRWREAGDARLDRLATMPGARIRSASRSVAPPC